MSSATWTRGRLLWFNCREVKDGFYDSEWSYYATKGDKSLITIGIHGMAGPAALEQEKAVATKILSHL